MPVRKRVPKYCHHKATGQAYVKLDGQFHFLGEYGSEESKSRCRDEIDRWMLRHSEAYPEMTVGELVLL